MLVTGGKNKKVVSVREELKKDPVTVHGAPVKVKEKDPYLGFIISQNGFVASVDETIKSRKIRGG